MGGIGSVRERTPRPDGRAQQEGRATEDALHVSTPHFMLVPSLACPAECSYCFGPHRGPTMSADTMDAALDFMARVVNETGQRKIKVTFHGGEPLMAGHALWLQALESLASRFGPGNCHVALQSNLWRLDTEFCQLFREHQVEIGTSLDGPEAITDRQRGPGYFANTMRGIRQAQAHDLKVGCIATFTPLNLPHWREVFDFFLAERIDFSIHAAVPPLQGGAAPFALTPQHYGQLLRQMLDYYVEHRRELAVSFLDQICQGSACGDGKVCTFRDCLGMFLAIDPSGDIYPCQRFCGRSEFRLGTLAERPSLSALFASPVAQRFAAREQAVRKTCRNCAHLDYCKGGCPYNAWTGGDRDRIQDPYCAAYRSVFDHIHQRLAVEMASEENINAIAERPYTGHGHPLLRKGPLIDLVRDGPHPSQIARTAKRIIAAVELARGPNLPAVGARLVQQGLCRSQQSAEASLIALHQQLHRPPIALNNLYLHVTFGCQLDCTHCYARARADGGNNTEMPVPALEKLIREAKANGLRQVIVTGGEPLIHSWRDAMLQMLAEARRWTTPMNLVLRTNLALRLDATHLRQIAAAVDQLVVSVDGNEQNHDNRRGKGTYAAVIRNLEGYVRLHREDTADTKQDGSLRSLRLRCAAPAELSLASVMRAADIRGDAGQAVRELARRLGVRRTRFRPILPLGRAQDWDEPPTSEALGAHADPLELIENGFHPVASCGLGQNLYVDPSGESFPCYAYHQPPAFLGNVIDNGLSTIVRSERFIDLARHSVDTNEKCHACELRYLCGGACRAWGGKVTQYNLDAAPPECAGLKQRATHLLAAAQAYVRSHNLHALDSGAMEECHVEALIGMAEC
jgi:uncharacterized protein